MATVDHSLFGSFHIILAIASVMTAVMAARFAARFVRVGAGASDIANSIDADARRRRLDILLLLIGMLLAMLETFKQIYLYFSSGNTAYDWWYFPFQLCSVPMYLCALIPFVGPRLRSTFLTFMGGYTFVSAVAALVYPEDILSAAPVMIAHGFIWHAILLFISLLIFMTGTADASAAGLARAALLFAALSVVALMINIAVEPVMQTGSAAHRYAAMFYLNPYHLSPQPIISDIQKAAGIPAGLLIYSIVTAIAGSLATVVAAKLSD
jgi:hypothetical protein